MQYRTQAAVLDTLRGDANWAFLRPRRRAVRERFNVHFGEEYEWGGSAFEFADELASGLPLPAILGTIVFLYGGAVFLRGGVQELRDRQPGMMTLISLAIVGLLLALTMVHRRMEYSRNLAASALPPEPKQPPKVELAKEPEPPRPPRQPPAPVKGDETAISGDGWTFKAAAKK